MPNIQCIESSEKISKTFIISRKTMRIFDENSDKSLENVTLYLTLSEAKELRDSLIDLIDKPLNNHSHIPSDDFQKELTVCIYDSEI